MPDGNFKRQIISHFSGRPYEPTTPYIPPPPTESQNYTSYTDLAGQPVQRSPVAPVTETPPPQTISQNYTSYADLRSPQIQRQEAQKLCSEATQKLRNYIQDHQNQVTGHTPLVSKFLCIVSIP